ncbi:MAG: lysylphosphatidylglycerol synthase transmembrane domain-containing protein [Solirubrobacteraceae bacterium]
MRKALSLLIKAAVSGLLLYFAVHAVDIGAVKARLTRIDAGWVMLGLAVLLIQLGVLALRWRRIAIRCGASLPPARAIRFSAIAGFFNQTLPSSVGGDAMRIWLLAKHASWRAAVYSVLLDRVVGVVALASLVIVCLPWTFALVRDPVGRGALLTIGFGAIAAGLVFIGLASERLQILQRWSPTRHLAAAAKIAASMLRSPRVFGPIFGLSIAIHLLTALAAWCAARSVGAELPLLDALILVPPVVLVTIIPVSIAGWGVREGAMVAAFAFAGLARSDGLIVSLLFGAGYLVLGVIGGLIWILTSNRYEGDAMAVAEGERTS